jgi:hypothetical protein
MLNPMVGLEIKGFHLGDQKQRLTTARNLNGMLSCFLTAW